MTVKYSTRGGGMKISWRWDTEGQAYSKFERRSLLYVERP